jgi:uncharacterized membrane protein YkoI
MNRWISKINRGIHLSPLAVFNWLMVLSFLVANPTSVLADDVNQQTARKLVSSGQILSLEEIHEKALLIKSGRIIETELERKKGRFVYEVELVDDKGLVWEIKLDAKTGQLIKLELD